MSSMMEYPLANGRTVNRFLISPIRQQTVAFEPVTLHGDVNRWMKDGFAVHENPCKTAFVAQRRTQAIQYASPLELQAGGAAGWMGFTGQMQVYFPFDEVQVNRSGFWHAPTYLSFWAGTLLRAPQAHSARFALRTCGGAAIWVNGQPVFEATPFTRNSVKRFSFDVPLITGLNRVDVFIDDLAERDTDFYFRLDYLGEQALQQCIAVGNADTARIRQAETALAGAAFARPTATQGDIVLQISVPKDAPPLPLSLSFAAEENLDHGEPYRISTVVEPGADQVVLGDCAHLPMGFLHVTLCCEVDGIPIRRMLALENFPKALAPLPDSDIQARKRQSLRLLAQLGENNVGRAAALLYTGQDTAQAEAILRRQLSGINARWDCSDFHLVYLPMLWRDFHGKGILPDDLMDEIAACIRNFRYWMDEPGDDVMWFFSENHALLFHTCQLLGGELFPNAIFTSSGLTGAQSAGKAKGLLLRWFEDCFRDGFTEWNSSAYLPINALGLGFLYAQAQDEQIRDLARKALDRLFTALALYSLDGFLACSAGRIYLKELCGNYINGTTHMNFIAFGTGNANQSAKGVFPICLSDYAPPQQAAALCAVQRGKALIHQATQGYEAHVNLYAYKTAGALLTTACDYRPGRRGYQEHVLHAAFGPESQLWINHPGEAAAIGCARPSYWAGNGCLPRVNQYRGIATAFYHIDDEHELDFTHLFLHPDAFDAFVHKDRWVFAAKGDAFCAVYAHQGLKPQSEGPNRNWEWISPGRQNAYLVRVSDTHEFTGFNAFVQAMLGADLQARAGHIDFADPSYGIITAGMEQALCVDGQQQVYAGYPTQGHTQWITLVKSGRDA